MKKCFSWPLLCVFALLVPASLSAHPHVFIDGVLMPKVSSDGRQLLGTQVRWSFDKIYSAQMILDFDNNQNGKFEGPEEESIYENAFRHLNDWHYFLEVRRGEADLRGKSSSAVGPARDFHASIENGKIVYQFFVPFTGAKQAEGLELKRGEDYILFLEDKEYFIAFDSILKPDLSSPSVQFDNKEFMVQNLQWGPYPVRAVSVKAL